VIGHHFLKPPDGTTEGCSGYRSTRDRRRCDRASGNQGTDTRDGKRRNAEQRPDASAGRNLTSELLRIAVAVGSRGLAIVLSDDGNRAIVDAGIAKLQYRALCVGVSIENGGYEGRAHYDSYRWL
jgi:hypothetical protein